MTLGLTSLGVLLAFSVVASGMPIVFAWPLALMAGSYVAWLVRHEYRRQTHQLVWPVEGAPLLDGLALEDAQLQWRGPLAFLSWRDAKGRRQHLAWWPDTLPPRSRRELRLAAVGRLSARSAVSMAP